jgi:hypothetical protein
MATTATKTTSKQSDAGTDFVENLTKGGQDAIGAVRSFLTSVDETLAGDHSPTAVQKITDSALEMSDRMVAQGGEALANLTRRG